MPSSTSSSSRLRALMRERSLWALVLFLVLAAGLEAFVHGLGDSPRGLGDEYDAYSFWYAKANHWQPEYDVVLVGDSRTLVGLSPEAMNQVLPALRIGNFAFNSAGLEAGMLHRAAALLDPDSTARVVVLGVTPHSLTPEAAKNEHFHEVSRQNRVDLLMARYLGGVMRYFDRHTLTELKDMAAGNRADLDTPPTWRVFHESGWMEADRVPPDPMSALEAYREQFRDNRVSPQSVEDVLAAVREWTGQGIRVVGFRPPVPQAMYDLDEALSGFDEADFASRFREAGGIWLECPPGSYETYDGSHLRAEAARAFSMRLARAVAGAPVL